MRREQTDTTEPYRYNQIKDNDWSLEVKWRGESVI